MAPVPPTTLLSGPVRRRARSIARSLIARWRQGFHDLAELSSHHPQPATKNGTALDRRLARIEKMLARVERRIDGAPAASGNLAHQRMDYAGADIFMRVTSQREKMRLRACLKEPWTVEWLETHVRDRDVLFDVGANVGPYSLVAAKRCGARVFSFEPSFSNYAALCENIVLNDLADRITPLPIGLAAETRMSVFNYGDLQPGAAYHTIGDRVLVPIPGKASNDAVAAGEPIYRQPILTYRLEDLVDTFGLPYPSHLKIDVDGGEIEVLDGAARVLDASTLRSLLIEVGVDLGDEIAQRLERHGLYLQTRIIRPSKSGTERVWYGVFGREPRPAGPETRQAYS